MGTEHTDFRGFVGSDGVQDLRRRISGLLVDRAGAIASDTVAAYPGGPSGGVSGFDSDVGRRAGQQFMQLLAFAIRDAGIDPHSGFVADVFHLAVGHSLPIKDVFAFLGLLERAALDELALNEAIGTTSEPWPIVGQLLRRGSFDVLAAYAERAQLEPVGSAIVDPLTTLHTRPVFDAAFAKVVDHASRFGDRLSLILFDVDHLAAINSQYGYGVGDRILERLGIVIKGFFRQHDWVARYSEDSIAIVLSRTDAEHASVLAERVVVTVQDRLEFLDHRTDQPVRLTVSAAVVNVEAGIGDALNASKLMADAEEALERAKRAGRNRVERVDSSSRSAQT